MVEGPVHAPGFIDAVLRLANYQKASVIFDVLTAAPMISPKLAPFGTLLALPKEMERLVESHIGGVRALLPPDAPAQVRSHFDGVAWIPSDLRANAPLADLMVVGPRTDWAVDWLRRRVIETLLLTSGTPLLLLPPACTMGIVNHAVLGWKPGAAATRALHELIHLAAPGARIDVVAVKHGLGDQPEWAIEPVIAMLKPYGFEIEGHALPAAETPQDALIAFALEAKADVLAIGGFAHSRLREIILGGVTRSLIDDPRLPILLAH